MKTMNDVRNEKTRVTWSMPRSRKVKHAKVQLTVISVAEEEK
jgi:hypothetical protein